jgi:hypothetical protein
MGRQRIDWGCIEDRAASRPSSDSPGMDNAPGAATHCLDQGVAGVVVGVVARPAASSDDGTNDYDFNCDCPGQQ